MNVVDSSAWLEYLANGPNADFFASPIEHEEELVVPTLCLYEVFKRILQQRSEDEALQAIALMQQGTVVELNTSIAVSAAKISLDLKLPTADSVIFSTALAYGATFWTQDGDFEKLGGVKYRAHSSKKR
ncbi:MAG: type II toxin-antitoxin system VapC family toxin [Nitrospirae bacterium]|nr:type II toxin-antitoxin system VapC family toxin [Candidatus Troglogloeales bacterium]MBI3598691.1 type II toxin-antitoxin system VapC family toxin [Candidatus Troglogloeales bacterium]